ncbi:uncharacterized protein [Cicer arietinum]|uniref:uncharacterized protein n=1 Tax=Cicer arietinum TaxID=3827 RepID=UPI003CC653EC
MAGMLMDTLQSPFYDKMNGSLSSNFSDMVMIGETVEIWMRSGKIICAASGVKKPQMRFIKRKEGGANDVMVNPRVSYFPSTNSYRPPNFHPPIPQIPYIPYSYVVATSQASYPQYHPSRSHFYHSPLEENPNVGSNPLSGYGNPFVNIIEDGVDQYAVRNIEHVKTLMKLIFAELCKLNLIKTINNKVNICEIHPIDSRLIKNYEVLKKFLQELMDRNFIQVNCAKDDHVLTIEPCVENNRSFPRPLEILYRKENLKSIPSQPNAIIGQAPTPFPNENTKAIPWNYEVTSYLVNHQSNDSFGHEGTNVTNISGIGGMTLSGRVYALEQLRKKEGHGEKGKKLLHRRALMKVLNEAHVTQDIIVDQFDVVFTNIIASSCLSFSDGELPVEWIGNNKALNISVKCHDHILARVLVGNGSLSNVMPKSTLSKLFVGEACMKLSVMVVKAFDGSRRQIVGETFSV